VSKSMCANAFSFRGNGFEVISRPQQSPKHF